MSVLAAPASFSAMELTDTVNKLPSMPMRMEKYFRKKGVRTISVQYDTKTRRIVLVGNQERGAKHGQHMAGRGTKRGGITLQAAHLRLEDVLVPDDLQDVRGFGSTELISADEVYLDKMQDLKDSLCMTLEFHRIGAAKGVVYDKNGSVLYDFYEMMGLAPRTLAMKFTGTGTKIIDAKQYIIDAQRQARLAMGGIPITRFEALAGEVFMDALTSHPSVKPTYELWLAAQAQFGNDNHSKNGFTYAGVTYIESAESIGDKRLVEANKAHVYPVAPGIFEQVFAPADWMETVNTMGREFYAREETLDKGRGKEFEVQSNPITFCSAPEALTTLVAE